jgi:hypothetical protein
MFMLIPLWVALALFGSPLGLNQDQVQDKYVLYAATDDASLGGLACDNSWTAPVAERFALACRSLPQKTVVVFTTVWPMNYEVQAYLLRHEVEHLLLGPGEDNAWTDDDEAPAIRAGCAVAFVNFCR